MFFHQLLLTTIFFYTTRNALCDQLYDETKEVCCDGTVHIVPANETDGHTCCGTQLLLNRNGVCCYDKIIPYPHNVTGKYDEWLCCRSDDHKQSNVFNFRTQRCCQGNVIDVEENFTGHCCGNTTFDAYQKVCCDNVIHVMDHRGQIGCCDGKLYNSTTHICCSQRPSELLDTDGLTDGKVRYKLQPLPNDTETKTQLSCCGLELYNFYKEACCAGVRHQLPVNSSAYDCCGTKLQTDRSKEVCCEGGIVKVTEKEDQVCCGQVLYNQQHELCCKGQVTTKAANVSCCWEAGQFYNPLTQRCCGDPLMPLPIDYDEEIDRKRCCRRRQGSS